MIPDLPESRTLADACREAAAAEQVQPWTVEKDFFLTRLLWLLNEKHGAHLLLKGGTCLSKVDLGYRRMSEDVDLIIPGVPTPYRSVNVPKTRKVATTLQGLRADYEFELVTNAGDQSEHGAHVIWELQYPSLFLPPASAVITVEAAIRPVLCETRNVHLKQLLASELVGDYTEARCWALAFDEVCAEKVRAALTREVPEIRDFYDLGLLASTAIDMASSTFVSLVDLKLAEVGAEPLAMQPRSFGLTESRRKAMEAGRRTLSSVLRADEPPFDLEGVLDHYDRLWGK